jgi:MSHA pilin protein MshA
MKKLSQNSFTKQQGFTLIELVVVIVILGILAATAAPKFIDLTGDARTSVMQGVQGSMNSAVNLAHAKALVAGQTGGTGEIEIGNEFYALVNGFPSAAHAGTGDGTTGNGFGIAALIELEDGTDITITDASPAVVTHAQAAADVTCTMSYANAANSETPPVLTATLTAC